MTDDIDWSLTTWEGSRRQQHRDFLALTFREKLEAIESLGELARLLAGGRSDRDPTSDDAREESTSMDIEIRHDSNRRRFVARLNRDEAHLQYSQPGEKTLDFESTFVPEDRRKKGIGERIVIEGLDYARQNGYQVIPSCPFVKHVLEENPEYADLVAGEGV